ncbi:Uma2 family endonuclease [Streptomyces sp. CA-132043]|uniref:Uma2 family endonuclease n=1 Tax=Streptomyces sp. CA-132043 TaxID=3240048 RepID=UPI003D8CC3EF
MTALAERPHTLRPEMSLEQFEELARVAMRHDDGPRLEFIGGRLGVKPVSDGDHGEIIMWLQELCMQHLPDLRLYGERGLQVDEYRKGRARPDGALARRRSFGGQGEWADPAGILMIVEVTSYASDTERRDRADKPRAYAEAGIPVYLLIDRDSCEVKVFSRPDGSRYDQRVSVAFGVEVALPDPVNLTLDTEPLKNWVS